MRSERPVDAGADRWTRWVVVLALAGVVLRLLGLRTELWMDEILSLRLVEALESPLGVFTAIHHDNNHYLNSLWLYVSGADAPWWRMRLPAIACGILLVPMAFRAAAAWGRSAALVASILVGLSYPMIHYSSEARGYAQVLVFALASWMCLRSWLSTRRVGWGAAYALCAGLGFLSHLGFATAFAAGLVWSSHDVLSAPGKRARRLRQHAAVHAFPALVLAMLYAVDIRHLEIAGGPRVTTLDSWLAAGGLLTGGAAGPLASVVALLAAGAVMVELARMFREGESEGLFFAFVLLLPLANAVVSVHAYRRYYLTAVLFALLLLARFAARGLSRRGRERSLAVALLVALVGLNVAETIRFLETGRGMYLEAVTDMAAASSADRPTVAGNHDLGNLLALEYYGSFAPGRPSFEYLCRRPGVPGCVGFRPRPGVRALPPAFFVAASPRNGFTPPARLEIANLADYSLISVYPKYGLSGLAWAVYRRSDPAPGRPPD